MPPKMTVQDYEAQARELFRALSRDEARAIPMLAAALRAAERSALERAAQDIESVDPHETVTREEAKVRIRLAKRLRALIAPAPEAPPAPDLVAGHSDAQPQPEPPYWRNGRHYAIHVYRGDTPIATFHAVEDAKAAVRAYNANLDLSAPAPDLAAQLDELSNALASHADAETGAKWDRLRAAVGARDERMAALEAAVRWALGEEGDFPTREPGEGAYWWRTELRRRAALSRSGAASGKEPP